MVIAAAVTLMLGFIMSVISVFIDENLFNLTG
jgi:hypothetical protein